MAPIPKKELMAAMRRKRKEGDEAKWNADLKKDRERKKILYHKAKLTLTEAEKEENREKTRLKVQKHRLKKKCLLGLHQKNSPVKMTKKTPYKTPQSLGKAVKKVIGSLPKSPGKQSAVIKAVVRQNFHLEETCRELFKKNNCKDKKCKDIEVQVTEFYCNDDISRQAPGKRDVRSIKDSVTGKREKIPIRHMFMTISEVYFEFKNRFPAIKVGLSKFFSLRPKFVLPASQTPHNVCVCKKHLNFSFLIEALHSVAKDFPGSYKSLLKEMCCNQSKEHCMFNECSECKYDVKVFLPNDVDLFSSIKWKMWEKVEGFLQVSNKVSSIKDVVEELNKQLPGFKEHTLVKRNQHDYFEYCKQSKDRDNAVVQVDFAENATLTAQNQIQSAHWRQRQVTIFTSVIWSAGQKKCVAIISNDLNHSKYAVWTFLKVIGNVIKKEFPFVDNLVFFSDNATSQFRSKFTVSNLCFLEEDLGVWSIEWVTFAASHGKGAVDGVGAVIKNQIWHKVKSQNLNINSAKEYYNEIEKSCGNVIVHYVPKEDIEGNEEILNHRWKSVVDNITVEIETVNPLQKGKTKNKLGLNSFHFFQKSDDKSVYAGRTARSELYEISVLQNLEDYEELSDEDTSLTKRQHYLDVYSSDAKDSNQQPGPSNMLTGFELSALNIRSDTYVKVQMKSEVTNKVFNYVGVCQGSVCEEEGEVLVMFMKMYKNDPKVFIMNDRDTKFVSFEQIVKILKPPKMKMVGDRIHYVFEKEVGDVCEQ